MELGLPPRCAVSHSIMLWAFVCHCLNWCWLRSPCALVRGFSEEGT